MKDFTFDYVLMGEKGEVALFNKSLYSKEEAIIEVQNHLDILHQGEDIGPGGKELIEDVFIIKNPDYVMLSEEEDIYLYAEEGNPQAVACWEVPFVLKE